MNLLLHVCCAPCLIYPADRLINQKFLVTGLYYNPNIHPIEEYGRRCDGAHAYSKQIGIKLIVPEYDSRQFFSACGENITYPKRCRFCWENRIFFTAQYAQQNQFKFFSTTLLVSPYQDHEALKRIGQAAQERFGVTFWYEDFRPGYQQARLKARALGLYAQKFCGCSYSESERNERKRENAHTGTR